VGEKPSLASRLLTDMSWEKTHEGVPPSAYITFLLQNLAKIDDIFNDL
jgi:hypothetical protein